MPKVAEILDSMDWGPAPEAADTVRAWLKSHEKGFGLFIGGAFTKAHGGQIDAIDPATEQKLGKIGVASKADVDKAVAAAKAAFPDWSKASGHARAKVLYALARLVQKQSRFLAVLETLDNGKPIRETRDIDIPLVARHFYYHAGAAQLLDQDFPGRVPHGVVGQVIPWNFPLLMLAWKIAPAIACGNTVVLKPAEHTSLTALYFAELCQEAGVPPGVINIVTGAGESGEALISHPDVAKVAFTGSTEVGRIIRERTAGSGKALTMELGGKSPFIVLEDADLDGAVEGLVDAIWFNQGEVCCAGSRLLVEEGAAERLVAKLKARLSKFRIGDPLDKAIDMGALVAPVQKARVSKLVDQARAEGAEVWRADIPLPAKGSFYPPTLITNAGTANVAWCEEIFGPVLTVMSFRHVKEAITLANNSRYGLAAAIWSQDINRALEIAAELKAGVVWVNTANQFDAAVPFGGYRESGFGREGGRAGLEAYLKPEGGFIAKSSAVVASPPRADAKPAPGIDRTPKNYIGGKQTRPDGGLTLEVLDAKGRPVARVGDGNRKDIRDAVEAASNVESWGNATAHNRAQILYYVAENLEIRRAEFEARLRTLTGASARQATLEVETSISRLFSYAAWADKYESTVHKPPVRELAVSVHEPLGVMGIVCPDPAPLLGFISLVAPAVAMGNRVVAVPSERYPLLATDLYQVLETSDVPGGVINIVTGARDTLTKTLSEHDGVDGLWYFGSAAGSAQVEKASTGNLKQTWVNGGLNRDWYGPAGEGREFLRRATQVKAIWVPYGS
ncbi:MAG: aldehyde dehydrogenase family protein [Caulobacteraceae bacterium]